MALNLLTCIFLFLSILSTTGYSKREIPNYKKTSPFEFINHLKGCHKGNHTKEIHHLKNYLHEFGYLSKNQTHLNNDDFDDALETAVKAYQHNFHVKPTGVIDDETVSRMTTRRCGMPDIVNSTNLMEIAHKKEESSSKTFHIVSHYTFFNGNLRWPLSKTRLTYGFLPTIQSRPLARAAVARAFRKWASVSRFTFSRARNYRSADLVIGFNRGDHGDGSPFNAGILAHAFPPTDGRFHYNANQLWSDGAIRNRYDLETVALHEIGHLLGLQHSGVEAAIMWPFIPIGAVKNLNADDINGIRALYN